MAIAAASQASGLELSYSHQTDEDSWFCDYVSPDGKDSSFYFMVVEGLIARVNIYDEGILTLSGIGVGSTEEEVRTAYPGRVISTSHPYTGPEGRYLTVEFEGNYAIIFETNGMTVQQYRAGKDPAIRWIEGCS